MNSTILLWIFAGSVLDAISTYFLSEIAIGEEQNPILKILMQKHGKKILIFWPFVETSLTYFLAFILTPIYINTSYIITLIPWIASTYNIIQIIIVKVKKTKDSNIQLQHKAKRPVT